jgi:hypothetical protein
MEKRYQVFVSSTYHDLQEERQEVMHALLELDCIPAGMELFPAANESQWSLIKRVIDECDYYLLIIAGRYGSCDPEGVSYTEKEYRFALSIGKPVIAFLHRDPGSIPAKNCESNKEGRENLEKFRSLAEKKLCKYWSTAAELGSVVSRSLVQLIKSTPAVGWVRADGVTSKEAMAELLRSRNRIEELETEIDKIRKTPPTGTEDLAQGKDSLSLRYSASMVDPLALEWKTWSGSFLVTWNDVFSSSAPLMINEVSDLSLKKALDSFVQSRNLELLSKKPELHGIELRDFSLNNDDFQTIKIQLRALGLIDMSVKARSIHDKSTYWTLTPYGDSTMTHLRAVKRTRNGVRKGAAATSGPHT